jgi:6-phosphogluconate dehydrogenase
MKIGLIGLGNMGFALMENMLDQGHEVIAWNRSAEKRENAKKTKATVVETVEELISKLDEQKVIFTIISAGQPIDDLFFGQGNEKGLVDMLSNGDIVADLANSHYSDSARRGEEFAKKGIKMMDIGISGGVEGARHGACMMIGGDKEAFKLLEPVFKAVTKEGGYGYFGEPGAGHFVKMVHNAIEYGMMQSISEGVALIDAKKEYDVDMSKLLDVWNHGSIVQSNLVGYLKQAYDENDNSIASEEDEIGDLGTGKWGTEEALKLGVPFTSISHAVFARFNSRHKEFVGWKAVSAMRRVFGAHSGKDRS